jgi:predicted dehydrogenase
MVYWAVLAGCGAMSRGWLQAVTTPPLNQRVEIVGLVDVVPGAAEKRAAEFGLDVVTGDNLATVLAATKPDMLFDVVIPAARRDVVETGLRNGCHVLSEKPMATSLEDGRAMVNLAAETGRMHAIMQNRRYNEGTRRIRAAIESGGLGELTAIHADFFVAPHFGGFREEMQNVLLVDMSIHTLDAARYMSGKSPVAVYCHESNPKGSWWAHGAAANAIFEMSDGVVFTYRGSWAAEGQRTSWDSSWRVVGTKGMLAWDGYQNFSAYVASEGGGFFRPTTWLEVPPPADVGETLKHPSVIAAFLDAVDAGTPPETAGFDNIKSLAMVFAAVESARLRQRVAVDA